MGEVEPSGTLVIEIGQRPFLELLGAGGVARDETRVANGADALNVAVPLRETIAERALLVVWFSRAGDGLGVARRSAFLSRSDRATWPHRCRIDVACPRAGGGAGEFERFGPRPLRRVEPVVPQPIQLPRRRPNRLPLSLRRRRKRKRLEARRRRVTKTVLLRVNQTLQLIHWPTN